MRAPAPRSAGPSRSADCRRDNLPSPCPPVASRALSRSMRAPRGRRPASSSNPFHCPAAGLEARRGTGGGDVFDRPVGVVIVDHGSRREEANGMLEGVVEAFRVKTGEEIVEAAHMEIAQPTLAEAICRCADQGAKTVVVTPFFLSNGRHIQDDIPSIVKEAAKLVPGVKCIVANALGFDPLIVDVLKNKVTEALDP